MTLSTPPAVPDHKSSFKIFFQGTLVLLLVSGVLAVPILLAWVRLQKPQAGHGPLQLPAYGSAPSFTLNSQNGTVTDSKSLLGKVWIADFIFSRCGTMCPLMTQTMKQLQKDLPGISFVSFTVDPEFDTPEVLKNYIKRFDLPLEGWSFLTGDHAHMKETVNGFKVSGANEPMFHSLSFVLVDPQGILRGYYPSNDTQAMEKLRKEASALRQAQNSQM